MTLYIQRWMVMDLVVGDIDIAYPEVCFRHAVAVATFGCDVQERVNDEEPVCVLCDGYRHHTGNEIMAAIHAAIGAVP